MNIAIDLERVRGQLRRRRQLLVKRAEGLRRELDRDVGLRAADVAQNDATLCEVERTAAAEVEAIEDALIRIEIGEYGLCKYCEHPIDDVRLKAKPEATTCRVCGS